jgi:hypothetical protein
MVSMSKTPRLAATSRSRLSELTWIMAPADEA